MNIKNNRAITPPLHLPPIFLFLNMTSSEKQYALIVAGGSGTRMNSSIPKQFLPLGGRPILMHTIEKFSSYPEALEIILVLPSKEIQEWKNLCSKHDFNTPHKIVQGGATRFHSVKNGLDAIDSLGTVAIHDGVRPFVSHSIIEKSFRSAEERGSGITAVQLKDSIRSVRDNSSRAEDRKNFMLIQTPQTFQLSLIKKAFMDCASSEFTDDASVLESSGVPVHLVEGSYENIKVTTPEDLTFAEAILRKGT